MIVLDKKKLVRFMGLRKDALYNQITRDFAGGLSGKLHEHSEVKIWKEAVERGEFDTDIQDVYVILSKTHPSIVDFTFYTDRDEVARRVEYLNSLAGNEEYWVSTLRSNVRNFRGE